MNAPTYHIRSHHSCRCSLSLHHTGKKQGYTGLQIRTGTHQHGTHCLDLQWLQTDRHLVIHYKHKLVHTSTALTMWICSGYRQTDRQTDRHYLNIINTHWYTPARYSLSGFAVATDRQTDIDLNIINTHWYTPARYSLSGFAVATDRQTLT